jgi:hypothetical protein
VKPRRKKEEKERKKDEKMRKRATKRNGRARLNSMCKTGKKPLTALPVLDLE